MKNITAILLPLFAAAMCLGCGCSESRDGEYGIPEKPGKPSVENRFLNRCDFENVTLTFTPNGPDYSVVTNPKREGLNRSQHCGKVVTAGNKWDLIWSEPLPRKLDFTRNAPVFKLKVLAPRAGAKVYFKIEPPQLGESNPKALEVTDVVTTKTGEWEELEFDFTGMAPESNMYQKIVLLFDAGGTSSGEKWYFDDIMCPDDDLTDICLFQRYEGNPVFEPEGPASWRNKHIANAGILSPANSPDGNWWLYCRGSGDIPYYCDQIGLYRQNASDFKPFGPWNEYEGNPVLPIGPVGSFDDGYLLDTAPVVGKDGVIYVYYQGNTTAHNAGCLCVRYSTDGIHFTSIDAPLLKKGCSDAVYHDGKYYIYYGGGNPCRPTPSTAQWCSVSKALTNGSRPIRAVAIATIFRTVSILPFPTILYIGPKLTMTVLSLRGVAAENGIRAESGSAKSSSMRICFTSTMRGGDAKAMSLIAMNHISPAVRASERPMSQRLSFSNGVA